MRVTVSLISANVIVFAMQLLFYQPFLENLALTGDSILTGLQFWRFFTYMFLHGDLMHITFNMFVLFMFGTVIEHSLGEKKYILLYATSGVGSAIFYLILMGLTGGASNVPMLGASGAIFGVLAAYGFMFPKNIIFVFPGIPVPAILAVAGLAVIEFVYGITGSQPGIANFGHLGGIVTGVLMMFYWKNRMRLSRSLRDRRDFEYFWE